MSHENRDGTREGERERGCVCVGGGEGERTCVMDGAVSERRREREHQCVFVVRGMLHAGQQLCSLMWSAAILITQILKQLARA